jgi:hypothetical protein
MADNYVPQIDYTSRDFTAIRNDLISLIPTFSPTWTSRDPADFGITLIELFSYMGDILNYYIDRSANESFITTASQRESVLQLARLLSYSPNQTTASTVTLTFQNATASTIFVPAFTKVATSTVTSGASNQIIFETDSSVTVPAKVGSTNGTVTVGATQGSTVYNEKIGTSSGTSAQTFQLLDAPVISNSITVNINGVTYNRVEYLIDYNNTDPVFTTNTDANGVTYVVFGDDVSGKIPPLNAEIFATYRVGGGIEGNVATGTIKYILTNLTAGLTVNNQDILTTGDGAATGGSDIESTDSIRINAVDSIRALNRAVSLSDYARLTVQIDGVAKANADATTYTSITLYFAPSGDKGVTEDGVTPSAVFNSLKTTVLEYLIDKAPANTTITFQPPTYVPIDAIVDLTIAPKANQNLVKTEVAASINTLLDFDNVIFQDTISLTDILGAVTSINGVSKANVTLLRRTADIQSFSISNKSLTSYIATLTTSAVHNVKVGQVILVSSVDSTFNGSFIVTAVGSNTISYALTANNVSSTAVSPSGILQVLAVEEINCGVSEIPTTGTITVTATGGIVN